MGVLAYCGSVPTVWEHLHSIGGSCGGGGSSGSDGGCSGCHIMCTGMFLSILRSLLHIRHQNSEIRAQSAESWRATATCAPQRPWNCCHRVRCDPVDIKELAEQIGLQWVYAVQLGTWPAMQSIGCEGLCQAASRCRPCAKALCNGCSR